MSQLFNDIRGYINENKKNIIIGIVLLVAVIVAYNVFSSGTDDSRVNEVKSNLQSVGVEQQRAAESIAESKRLTEQLRQANINLERATKNIQQSNKSIRSTVSESQQLNKSSADLIAEGKSILRNSAEREQGKN